MALPSQMTTYYEYSSYAFLFKTDLEELGRNKNINMGLFDIIGDSIINKLKSYDENEENVVAQEMIGYIKIIDNNRLNMKEELDRLCQQGNTSAFGFDVDEYLRLYNNLFAYLQAICNDCNNHRMHLSKFWDNMNGMNKCIIGMKDLMNGKTDASVLRFLIRMLETRDRIIDYVNDHNDFFSR